MNNDKLVINPEKEFFVIPVKLALYHTVQGLSQQVVSRERESRLFK